MARAGLGSEWRCVFANDFDARKGAAYTENWGDDHLKVADVNSVKVADLPGEADLAWASFPCQDLSLAGDYVGLSGERSGTFWPFWKLMRRLADGGRAPKIITIENVYGALTSNDGADFLAIAAAFFRAGYRFGAMVIDARHFVPQSRPRFFVIGIRGDLAIPPALNAEGPKSLWHPSRLIEAVTGLTPAAAKRWVWWNLPQPSPVKTTLSDIVEETPTLVEWHSPAETKRLLEMMSPLNREKVKRVSESPGRHIGTIYRRTRKDDAGEKQQRAEVRFDKIAGCLRTPRGGSSRQILLVVEGKRVRSRLLSAREAARLMGLPDDYALPNNYNDAYHLAGDGVVVPVVAHLSRSIFEPVIAANTQPALLAG